MKAISNALQAVADAQKKAEIMQAVAPHVFGEPRLFYPGSIYGAVATCVYKVRDGAGLAELLAAYPPEECARYKGTFSGVKPLDAIKENDGEATPCDGVIFKVEESATTGAYPCDQHPLSAQWYTATPAGRLNVRVDFNHNNAPTFPRLLIRYKSEYSRARDDMYDSRVIASISLSLTPAGSRSIQYGSGDRKTPGSFLVYFPESSAREAFVSSLVV